MAAAKMPLATRDCCAAGTGSSTNCNKSLVTTQKNAAATTDGIHRYPPLRSVPPRTAIAIPVSSSPILPVVGAPLFTLVNKVPANAARDPDTI